jgi:Ca2+-binding RTX toxin-like protein
MWGAEQGRTIAGMSANRNSCVGRRAWAVVGAAVLVLPTLGASGPVGPGNVPDPLPSRPDDCFGQPLPLSTIYVPANSTGWTEGTSGDDVIIGTDGPDNIDGLGGSDTICGNGGDDDIFGDSPEDIGGGVDQIDGGAGDDVIFGRDAYDLILGSRGDDTIDAGNHNDAVFGGGGDDEIFGGEGDDTLYGQAGDDIVHCGEDDDGTDDDYGMGNEGYDWDTDCETWWTDDWPGPE